MGSSNDAMLRRLVANGFPVDLCAIKASFNLTITPLTTIDVDAQPLIDFSQRVKEIVRKMKFQCELADIAVIPMVLNPDIRPAQNSVSYKKASRAYIIRRNIDFSAWQIAKLNQQMEMLALCVTESILSIPPKQLSEQSKDQLAAIVCQAAHSKKAPRILKSKAHQ